MSGQIDNLGGAINPDVDSGVEHGQELVRFTAAITGTDIGVLNTAREAAVANLGSQAMVSASMVAANFSMRDLIANAIGINLDGMILKPLADIRELLGINNFPSAANTLAR